MLSINEEEEKLDLNGDFLKILDLMENTNENLFISGQAGTGKSTMIDYFRLHTKKNCVVLAPTGVAALNVKGQTIHSFFGFKPGVLPVDIKETKNKQKALMYKKIDINSSQILTLEKLRDTLLPKLMSGEVRVKL